MRLDETRNPYYTINTTGTRTPHERLPNTQKNKNKHHEKVQTNSSNPPPPIPPNSHAWRAHIHIISLHPDVVGMRPVNSQCLWHAHALSRLISAAPPHLRCLGWGADQEKNTDDLLSILRYASLRNTRSSECQVPILHYDSRRPVREHNLQRPTHH